MAANPTSPDAGVYVQTTTQVPPGYSVTELWSTQSYCTLSDGTMILLGSYAGATDDELRFWYSTDQGASWTLCSTTITPNPNQAIDKPQIIAGPNDYMYVTCNASTSEYYMEVSFSGSDITNTVSPAGFSGGDLQYMGISAGDPGTGSAYDAILYISTSGPATWDVYGVSQGTSITALDTGNAYTNSPNLYGGHFPLADSPSGNGGGQFYNDTDEVITLLSSNLASNAFMVEQFSHSTGTTWTSSGYATTPSGWGTVSTSDRIVLAWNDGTYYNVMFWDDSANEFKVARATKANVLSSWSTRTSKAEDATYAVTATQEGHGPRAVYVPALDKVLVAYNTNGQTAMVYIWYDSGTDTWDTSWSTFQVSASVVEMWGGQVQGDTTPAYAAGTMFVVSDDSSQEWQVFNGLATSAGTFDITDTALTDTDTLGTDSIKRLVSDPALSDSDTLQVDSLDSIFAMQDTALSDGDTLTVDYLMKAGFTDQALVDTDTLNQDVLNRVFSVYDTALTDADTLTIDLLRFAYVEGDELELSPYWLWQFVRQDGHLHLIPSRNRQWFGVEGTDYEVVSSVFRYNTSKQSYADLAVWGVWELRSEESAASLKTWIDTALGSAGFVDRTGTLLT